MIYTKHKFNISLRKDKPKYRTICYVCNKHKEITEWHHITPVSEIVKEIIDIGEFLDENIVVSLCPNCHSYLHKLNKMDNNIEDKMGFFKNLKNNNYTKEENLKFCNLENVESFKETKEFKKNEAINN